MDSPLRRRARLPLTLLALALAAWIVTGPSAFAKGGGGGGHGGGGGGGGHGGGGGGHGGGGHGGGYHGGGYHGGGYYGGGYNRGYYYPFYGGAFYGGYYGNGYGYGYSYPYSYYDNGYAYPNYGYGYSQGYMQQVPPPVYAAPAQGRYLGIDEQPVADANGSGMRVVQVYAGTPAQQAGLQAGDVIYSANGYSTQQHGNLTWIISTVPTNGALQMTVRSARDGAMRVITATMP